MKYVWGMLAVMLTAAPASAQITVDGTKDAGYGSALAVQTVNTSFGDNFSEMDAGYAVIDGGNLCLMLTGNVEANFNKLEIFIDSKAGGQSVFDSSGNDDANRMDGLQFDVGFTADYHIIFRRGTDSGNQKVDVDFANLGTQSASGYSDIFFGDPDLNELDGSATTGTGVNPSPIAVGYNNSNTAGVGGDGAGTAANQADALAVTTGLELCIALSDLGYAGGNINIMVGQNGGGHDYWSNQFLGGLQSPQGSPGGDGAGNYIGGPSGINMQSFAGDQFFTLAVPEPGSMALAGLALAGLVAARRRK